jgi:hypothetical protein
MRTDGQTGKTKLSKPGITIVVTAVTELPKIPFRQRHFFAVASKGVFVTGVKWRGRGADHNYRADADIQNGVGLYLHSHISFHGFVLTQPKEKCYFTEGTYSTTWIKYRCTVWYSWFRASRYGLLKCPTTRNCVVQFIVP